MGRVAFPCPPGVGYTKCEVSLCIFASSVGAGTTRASSLHQGVAAKSRNWPTGRRPKRCTSIYSRWYYFSFDVESTVSSTSFHAPSSRRVVTHVKGASGGSPVRTRPRILCRASASESFAPTRTSVADGFGIRLLMNCVQASSGPNVLPCSSPVSRVNWKMRSEERRVGKEC